MADNSLCWAVQRGNEELMHSLLAQQKGALSFRLDRSANTAMVHGHVHLVDQLLPDPAAIQQMLINHYHEKCPATCAYPKLFERVDFSQCDPYDQKVVFKKAVSCNKRTLIKQWIDQLQPTTNVKEIGRELIECKLEQEFLYLFHKYTDQIDLEDLCPLIFKHDCVNIFLDETVQQHSTITQSAARWSGWSGIATDIIKVMWKELDEEQQENILKMAASNNKKDVLSWAFEHGGVLAGQVTSLAEKIIQKDFLHLMDLITTYMNFQDKQKLIQRLSSEPYLATSKNNSWQYLQQWMTIANDINDPHEQHRQHMLLNIATFDLFAQWAQTGQVEPIKQWRSHMTDRVRQNVLNTAAEYGQLNVVALVLQWGDHNPMANHLAQAAKNGHIEVVDHILKLHQHKRHDVVIAMEWATYEEHIDVMRILHPHCDQKILEQSLVMAASEGLHNALALLLDWGITFTQKSGDINLIWGGRHESSKNNDTDTFLSSIVQFFPQKSYNYVLFQKAVKKGHLQTARALIDRFDHHPQLFHHLMGHACSTGDLEMVELLKPHFDFTVEMIDSIGRAATMGQWPVLLNVIDHCKDPVLNRSILWQAIESSMNKHTKIALIKEILPYCDMTWKRENILCNMARKNVPEMVDLVFHLYSLDEIQSVIKKLLMEGENYDELYLTKLYEQDMRRQELVDAAERIDCNQEEKKIRKM